VFDLYPIGMLYGGNLIYPVEKAREVLDAYAPEDFERLVALKDPHDPHNDRPIQAGAMRAGNQGYPGAVPSCPRSR
jgi:hypothetical protein